MYDPKDLKLRPNVPLAIAGQLRKDLAGYYAHCTALDRCIGELAKTLKEQGLDQNTILVFTSDHGDMLGSQANIRKQRPWDESIRIPLLIHYPAAFGESGKQSDALLNAPDLMPTLLGLCNVTIPKTVEGFDYSKYLMRGRGKIPEDALLTCPVPFGEFTPTVGGREYRGIRTERYTYVRDLHGPWLLYDNQVDPYQLTNLCNRDEVKNIQAKLEKTLQKRLRETGDKFLPGSACMEQWSYVMDARGSTKVQSR
jgi:arylsulfatase A-like enzyme